MPLIDLQRPNPCRSSAIVLLNGLMWVAFFSGCSQVANNAIVDHQMQLSKVDQLGVSTEYVFSENQFDNNEYEEKVSGGLNRWISGEHLQIADVDWHVDPMVATLPEQVEPHGIDLADNRFTVTDAHYIQGQMWLKSLANTIVDRPLAPSFWPPIASDIAAAIAAGESQPVRHVFGTLYPGLDNESLAQLENACKLFDWTICNVQLVESPNWPDAAMVRKMRVNELETQWPPAAGVRGAGYTRFVWQNLLYGRADGFERSRVFIQLLRQIGIDAVMLGIEGETSRPFGYQEWLPGVRIGKQVFLFDAELGIPLFSDEPKQFATLADLVERPEQLKSLDLTVDESTSPTSRYRIRPDEMTRPIIALIDAPVPSLTRRMAVLERNLTGDQRLLLACQPEKIAERWREIPHLSDVRLWPDPWMTVQFRSAIREAALQARFNSDIRERLAWQSLEEEYVDGYVRIRTAKQKYYRNQLNSPRGITDRGAIEAFQLMRYPDDWIDNLHDNQPVLSSLGISKFGMSVLEYNARLNTVKNYMRLVRADATYYLALCHFESGNPDVAITWLDRVKEFDTRRYWETGTEYLLGRCHEILGDLNQAIQLYEKDKNAESLSAQTRGNLLRARFLKQHRSTGHP